MKPLHIESLDPEDRRELWFDLDRVCEAPPPAGTAVIQPLEALLAPAPYIARAWCRLQRELRRGVFSGALGHR